MVAQVFGEGLEREGREGDAPPASVGLGWGQDPSRTGDLVGRPHDHDGAVDRVDVLALQAEQFTRAQVAEFADED